MKKLAFLLVTIGLFSCVNKSSDSKGVYEKIDVDIQNAHEYAYSDLVDTSSLEFIRLETSDNCLLGQFMRFHKCNDEFVFLSSNKVVAFSSEGKFLYSINKQGRGPGEYGYLMDVFVDSNDFVYVLDMIGKIVKYDKAGNHIKTFKTGLQGQSFAKLDEDNWVIYTGSNRNKVSSNRLNFFSEKQEKIVGGKQEITKSQGRWMQIFDVNNFSKSLSDNLYNYSCNDTLYMLKGNDIKPFAFVDYGKNSVPASMKNKPYKDFYEFYEVVNKNNLINSFATIFNTCKHLYFSFRQKGKLYQAIYNWKSKEIKIVDKVTDIYMAKGLVRDIDFNFVARTSDADFLYNKIDPIYIEELTKSNANVPACLKDVKADDNPVIVRYRLRN